MADYDRLNLQRHIPVLDGIRGLAILLVMVHHFTVITPIGTLETWFDKASHLGMHGVDLFFVLSGFLITGILIDSKDSPNFLRNFYIRRTLRIFPLYYAVTGFSFLILPFLLSLSAAGASKLGRFETAAGDWIWYLLYCSNFTIAKANAFRHGILDVTWSLAIEEQFYLVWAIAVLFLSRRTLQRVCVGAIISALVIRIVMWRAGYSWLQIYVLTPSRIDALAWGSLIALWLREPTYDPRKFARWAGGPMLATTIILGFFFYLGFLNYTSPLSFTMGYSLIGIFFAQLVVSVLYTRKGSFRERIFASKFFIFFGKYSYAIYLFHLPIRAVIRDAFFGETAFRQLPGFALGWQMIFYVLATLAVIPLALLSWNLYEKQFLKLKVLFPSGVEVTRKDKTAQGPNEPMNPADDDCSLVLEAHS
jgi:peptidoglycan/LPS O-acetylase OafA/YrhL